MIRLGIFISHPIPYFVPLWRALSKTANVDLTVYFFSRTGLIETHSDYFEQSFKWDLPLLEGYQSEFLADWAQHDYARKGYSNMKPLIKHAKLDAVLVHGYVHKYARQAMRAAISLGIRRVARGPFTSISNPASRRSAITRLARDLYVRRFLKNCTAVAYIGNCAREELVRLGVGESKLFHSPYSIDIPHFEAARVAKDRESIRSSRDIPKDAVVILMSGALRERKNPHVVLNAVKRMEHKNNIWLAFVGSGPLQQEVFEASRQIVNGRVIMPGFANQSELADYYLMSDIYVFPSLYDSWGIVLNEAMLFELPVICSKQVSASRDLIVDGRTGVLFDPTDPASLSVHLDQFACDKAMRRSIGRAARRHVSSFTPERSARGLLEAINHSE